jgi:hypothetical protein
LSKLNPTQGAPRAGLAAREVVDRFRDAAASAGCELSLTVDAPVAGLWDRLRIEQVESASSDPRRSLDRDEQQLQPPRTPNVTEDLLAGRVSFGDFGVFGGWLCGFPIDRGAEGTPCGRPSSCATCST